MSLSACSNVESVALAALAMISVMGVLSSGFFSSLMMWKTAVLLYPFVVGTRGWSRLNKINVNTHP